MGMCGRGVDKGKQLFLTRYDVMEARASTVEEAWLYPLRHLHIAEFLSFDPIKLIAQQTFDCSLVCRFLTL